MTEIEIPEAFADVLSEVAEAYYRLREPLTDEKVTDTWIAGFVAATKLKYGHARAWVGGPKGYSRQLPFVIEGRCPLGHRTADQYDYATIRIVIRQGGAWSYDPASPCPECTAESIRDWMVTCRRCLAGEDSERHYPFHAALDLTTFYVPQLMDYSDKPADFEYVEIEGGGFDASPLAWIAREFMRLGQAAAARWWLEHPEEAAETLPSGPDRQRLMSERLAWAREVLGALPAKSAAGKPDSSSRFDTPEKVAKWLGELRDGDDNEAVPASASTRAAWEVVKDFPKEMRPSKNQCDYAQAIRNGSRAT